MTVRLLAAVGLACLAVARSLTARHARLVDPADEAFR